MADEINIQTGSVHIALEASDEVYVAQGSVHIALEASDEAYINMGSVNIAFSPFMYVADIRQATTTVVFNIQQPIDMRQATTIVVATYELGVSVYELYFYTIVDPGPYPEIFVDEFHVDTLISADTYVTIDEFHVDVLISTIAETLPGGFYHKSRDNEWILLADWSHI